MPTAVYAMSESVRPSVRPSSVTFRCFVETNEATIMRFSPTGRTIILVRPNCTKLAEDTEGSLLSYEIVSDFRYLAVFSNAGRSNSSYVENDAKFRTF